MMHSKNFKIIMYGLGLNNMGHFRDIINKFCATTLFEKNTHEWTPKKLPMLFM